MKLKRYKQYRGVKRNIEINLLIKGIRASQKRYSILKQVTKSKRLRTFCSEKIKERKRFELELRAYCCQKGRRIIKSGTHRSTFFLLHHKIKTTFEKPEDQVILTKLIYFEESLVFDYSICLDKLKGSDKPLYNRLILQLNKLSQDLKKLESLKSTTY